MGDFGSILRRGRKVFEAKDGGGTWGLCEECGKRKLLFKYYDVEKEIWLLCEGCITSYTKEDEEEE